MAFVSQPLVAATLAALATVASLSWAGSRVSVEAPIPDRHRPLPFRYDAGMAPDRVTAEAMKAFRRVNATPPPAVGRGVTERTKSSGKG